MRVLNLAMVGLLPGCAMGFSELPERSDDTAGMSDPVEDEGGGAAVTTTGTDTATSEAVTANLEGRLYAVTPEALTITQPPGLDAMKGEFLTRDILVYVASESESRIKMDVALAGTDGSQDDCERVVALPSGDWSENPWFDVGPGSLEASFGTFRDLTLTGSFDADGARWTDGELDAMLDARELAAALPDGTDVCGLVDAMGGACVACDDGSPSCFDLTFSGITATAAGGAFDPTPVCAN